MNSGQFGGKAERLAGIEPATKRVYGPLHSATELQAHVVGPRGIEPPDLPRIASDAQVLWPLS